jgi:hypothetical protein
MEKEIPHRLLICFVLLLCGLSGKAQTGFTIKADILGPILALPSLGDFGRISPEICYQPANWKGFGITADFEYVRWQKSVEGYYSYPWYPSNQILKGNKIAKEQSFRLGLRKNWALNPEKPARLFAELQTGYAQQHVDTVFEVPDQRGQKAHDLHFMELRFRTGYKFALAKRWVLESVLEFDPKRWSLGQPWFRVVCIELNLGFIF